MNKKVISIFTLLAFVVFSLSCYTTRLKQLRTTADWEGKIVKILSVEKTSGEYIKFSKDNPGRIDRFKITGTATRISKKVEIYPDEVKEIRKHHDGSIFELINKEGEIFHVVGTVIEEEDKFIFFTTYETSESVSIPFSEVKMAVAMIKKKDPVLTFLASIGKFYLVVGALFGVGILIFIITYTITK